MKRSALQIIRIASGLVIALIVFLSILYAVSLPDRFTEVKAQQEYPTTYQAFLHKEYHDLAIEGFAVAVFVVILAFLFKKTSSLLKNSK
jgi:hypothetical protein